MTLKEQLAIDVKAAMIARDSLKTDVLKGVKTAILYAEVATNKREEGLSDEEVLKVLQKESKKRQESAELYTKGDRRELAEKELSEKQIIDAYLPKQLDETAVNKMIDDAAATLGISTPTKQDMGKLIGAVKAKAGAEVDGSMLARLVSGRISE